MQIKLSQIVDALESTNQNTNGYLHKETYQIVFVSDDDFRELELFEKNDNLEIAKLQEEYLEVIKDVSYSDNYYSLPSSYDIHEHMIMQKYCYTLDLDLESECLNSIFKSGAFRRFKAFINNKGLTSNYYSFRTFKFIDIAIGWLEKNEIAYFDDLTSK